MWRVKDWASFYEKARTKAVDGPLDWVAVRVNLSSLGYGRLMTHERGAAHFGVWVTLLELAADLPRDLRGCICGNDGNEYSVEDISVKTRIPSELVTEAIGRLVELGWIEAQSGADNPRESAPSCAELRLLAPPRGELRRGNATRQDITRQNSSSAANFSTDLGRDLAEFFEERYAVHPKKRNRTLAEQAMCSVPGIDGANVQAEFKANHDLWCESEEWRWKAGAKAPDFAQFINDQTWKYKPPEVVAALEAVKKEAERISDGTDPDGYFA